MDVREDGGSTEQVLEHLSLLTVFPSSQYSFPSNTAFPYRIQGLTQLEHVELHIAGGAQPKLPSQTSIPSLIRFPQLGLTQLEHVELQVAGVAQPLLPSQTSIPSLIPFPQTGVTQLEHVELHIVGGAQPKLPSQTSIPSLIRFPHIGAGGETSGSKKHAEHPSPLSVFPSSHCSPSSGSTIPFPHIAGMTGSSRRSSMEQLYRGTQAPKPSIMSPQHANDCGQFALLLHGIRKPIRQSP